ncbi:YbaB/EbfC family nucleoid-associated protein [Saccharothrix variisporea]|uniref:DNA-binding protein YbaB n=1 Tax=Saccharothrix variisporea TaxID=543527 RepID=A0A495X108_9PSEU|nr:YbaB/EbfC family nucleoid-associated protein [Saccharothrix variisporea]RKT67176.1 DNA-binding protein YbaB [Saccharothrix variisporea]
MDETLRELGIISDYEQLAEDVRVVRQRLAEVRVTVESPDGMVGVTVGGAGELVDLWLDPRIYRRPDSDALARTITETVRRAVRGAQERGVAIAAAFLPADATPESADLRFDPFLRELDRR